LLVADNWSVNPLVPIVPINNSLDSLVIAVVPVSPLSLTPVLKAVLSNGLVVAMFVHSQMSAILPINEVEPPLIVIVAAFPAFAPTVPYQISTSTKPFSDIALAQVTPVWLTFEIVGLVGCPEPVYVKKRVFPLVGLEPKVTLKVPLPMLAVFCADWTLPEGVVSDKEVGVKKETAISNAQKSIINIAR
jgi:hypothetical protein